MPSLTRIDKNVRAPPAAASRLQLRIQLLFPG